MSNKPTDTPEWATGAGSELVKPSTNQSDLGFRQGQKPPAQYFNWIFNNIYLWILWIKEGLLTRSSLADSTPIMSTTDRDGRVKSYLGPEGFVMGPVVKFNLDWLESASTIQDESVKYDKVLITSNETSCTASFNNLISGLCSRPLVLTTIMGGDVNDFVSVNARAAGLGFIHEIDNTTIVLETIVSMTGSTDVKRMIGFCQEPDLTLKDPVGSINPHCMVYRRSSDSNFMFSSGNGVSTITLVDTGVSVTDGDWYSIRIELHGANTPVGVDSSSTVARVFINGALVHTQTGTLPTSSSGPLDFVLQQRASGVTTATHNTYFGNTKIAYSETLTFNTPT